MALASPGARVTARTVGTALAMPLGSLLLALHPVSGVWTSTPGTPGLARPQSPVLHCAAARAEVGPLAFATPSPPRHGLV